MTDLNTQMTPEAMMEAEIERLTAQNKTLIAALKDDGAIQQIAIARAEKAERETAELRAQTDALIRATYEDAAQIAESYRGGKRHANRIRYRTPADAKAALEARDRAMRNEGIRKAAEICDHYQMMHIHAAILYLIEKEPEGKGDE
ncbi:hypothetical protein [Paenirhodobacter populi]|uniref:hypothetical protein n=1 Tax=Paenirhodobacter populi TaxID=2306993 RepID=UPI000FE3A228|nr:hypothetical protein [Sinirhodobacter populi]RWR09767.1 hypothetical protein D2T32_05345 [Sinirhodobacter populi]